MAFDYKKEYKEFYLPKNKPELIDVPEMNFIAVRGKGDPNEEEGEYKAAMGLLYGIAFTIKMSYRGSHKIEGYFDYVVPPLEGFWWQGGQHPVDAKVRTGQTGRREGVCGIDYTHKEDFQWISLIRLPDFVTREDFAWAVSEAMQKKEMDFSKVEYFTYNERMCVQCMHIGPYDEEPETIRRMEEYAREQGYEIDITDTRYHHEIYLSDARRCKPERLKTVIRHPVRKREG